MRTRNKILAFVLAMLMIVGVLPLSVFAATGKSSEQETAQTREEWVKANGGTMLFGSSFDDAGKVNGANVSSDAGMGNGTAGRTNATNTEGTTKVWVDTDMGALRLVAGDSASDFWPVLNTKSDNGDTWVVEMELKFNKHYTTKSNSIMYFNNGGLSSTKIMSNGKETELRVDAQIVYYVYIDENTWGLSNTDNASDAFATFKLGEMAKFAVVCDPVTTSSTVYVDGEYRGSGYIFDSTGRYHMYNDNADNDIPGQVKPGAVKPGNEYPSFNTVRFLQITGLKNQDIELHSLYAYSGVDIPYGYKGDVEGGVKIGQALRDNGYKLLNYQGFDNIVRFTASQKTVVGKGSYLITPAQYFLDNKDMKNPTAYLQINAGKNAETYINRDENTKDFYLRFKTDAKNTNDVYMDIYADKGVMEGINKFTPGDTVVYQADYRRSVQTNVSGWTLMGIGHRGDSNGWKISGVINVQMDRNGAITVSNTPDESVNGKVLGYVSTTEFTNVAIIINTKNNTFSVAIDGSLVLTDKAFATQAELDANFGGKAENALPNEVRIGASAKSGMCDGYLDVNNFVMYSSDKITNTNFLGYDAAEKDGWYQTDAGYWRYYENGLPAIGYKEIDGKNYYFGPDGYYSELQSEWLLDMNQQTMSDTTPTGNSIGLPGLSVTEKMAFSSWRYSALWTDIYKEGMPGNVHNSVANTLGVTGTTFDANNTAVNPEFVRFMNATEEKIAFDAAGRKTTTYVVTGDKKVFDFEGYVAIEVDFALNKDVSAVMKAVLHHNANASVYGNYAKYTFFNNTAGSGTYQVGLNTTYLDLTGDSTYKLPGAVKEDYSHSLRLVKSFKLDFDWDNPNTQNYTDGLALNIVNINLVKAVAVKTDTCPKDLGVVRTVNGKTSIYKDNMSVPNVGWIEYDGNKYFADADGVLMTGVVEIFDVKHEFDDNGKLVGFADGIYTINGKNYYYQNGAAKVGEFTVDGKSFNTRGDGEIVNMDAIIPGNTIGTFLKPDYSVLGDAIIGKASFDARPITGEGSYFGSANTETMTDVKDSDSLNALSLIVRRTKVRFVQRDENDVALKLTNATHYRDTYLEYGFGSRVGKDLVVDMSIKLGDDWNASMGLIQLQDRGVVNSWSAPAFTLNLTNDGYVVIGNSIICRLSTAEYTRLSVVHNYSDSKTNYFDVYVNGVKVFTDVITNDNFRSPTMARMFQYRNGYDFGYGTIYVDDLYAYSASEPVATATAELKNGVYNDNGFNRYYVNGVIKTGVNTVNGDIYSFEATHGLGINGFDANGYYCVDGKAEKYQGVTTVEGKDYLFSADYKVVKNANTVQDIFDNKYAYSTDENGVVTDRLIFDGAEYSSAGTIGNNVTSDGIAVNSGSVQYNPVIGQNTFKPNQFAAETVIFDFDEPTDITGNDYVVINMYLDPSFAGKTVNYGLVYGGRTTYYVLNGYNPGNNTYVSIDSTPNYGWPNGGQYKYEGKPVYCNGMSVFKRTVDDGNGGTVTEYLGRVWDYDIYQTSFVAKAGINTVYVPVNVLTAKATKVEYISFTTAGWQIPESQPDLNNAPAYEIISASFVNYDEPVENRNGWINGKYYVDGVMTTGWYLYEGTNWYYFDPVTGYKVTGIVCVPQMPTMRATGYAYYEFNSIGVSQGLATGTFPCTEWTYDAEKGEYVSEDAIRVVVNGQLVTGVVSVDGSTYYVDPDTNAAVTDSVVSADWDNDPTTPDEPKAVGSNGVVAKVFEQWVEADGNLYYNDASGKLASGYTYVAKDIKGNEGGYYYFDPVTNVMYKSQWATVYGAEMFFTENGKAADGIVIDPALADRNAKDNTGYFIDGVPATTELIDGGYKYIFINGMLFEKIEIKSDAPEILIKVTKDGVTTSFFFPVNADGSFEKVFESYSCYELEIYDISDPDAPVKVEITNNTLTVAAGSTAHTYEVRYLPVAHSYVEKTEWYKEPTCGIDGYKVFVCELCGASYNETVPATGAHTPGEWQIVKNPTCTHEGLKVAYCTGGCGTFVSEKIDRDPTVHNIITDPNDPFYTYKAPTCTVDGYASGVCEWCGERQETDVLEATGHDFSKVTEWFTEVHATCVTKGSEWGYCGNGCGEKVYRDIPVDTRYHVGVENGVLTHQSQAGENFSLFQTVVASTCATPGHGIFRCLACGGFIENVPLNLDLDNHEWGDEYLVIFDEDGNIIETIYGANREEILEKSLYLCGYNGAWRRDCTNTTCVLEDGVTRIFTTVELVTGSGNHKIDLSKLVTTLDPTDPLYGMHYYVCSKCEKAIQATAHVMSEIRLSADGLTHIVYCKGGCIIAEAPAANANMIGTPYFIEENCEHKLSWVVIGGAVTGHGDLCKCGHLKNYVEHNDNNLKEAFNETQHWTYCEDCGFSTTKIDHTIKVVPAQTATCYQIGWDEYDVCENCGYVEAHTVYNQLPHNIPADSSAYSSDNIGHWYACRNDGCNYKHLYEKHTLVHIDAMEATCDTDGSVEHDRCIICEWCDPDSFDPNDYANYPNGIIPAKGHHPAGEYHYNDEIHWQFCDNVNNGKVCGMIIKNAHSYEMGADFTDYNDEEGTANHKCKFCDYKKPLTGLETWWSVLGLTREGTAGAYTYHLVIDGAKMKDYLAKLPDGSYRYFDAEGNLVMAAYSNGQFDEIKDFGPDGLANLIKDVVGYYGYNDPKAGERGAIKNAIVDTADGVFMVENGAIVTGWKTIKVGTEDRDYYFNSKLNGVLVNANLPEGALVKSTATEGDLTIDALNVTGDAVILVNVRADGSRLLGVIDNGDGTACFYLDGYAGKRTAGWVNDTYTEPGKSKMYLVLNDNTLASGNYVVAPGGVHWNFNAADHADYPYLRADSHCRNEQTDKGVYLNAEGKVANNELVTIDATGKTYFIVNVEGVQSIYQEKEFVLVGDVYYAVDVTNGEIDPVNGFYTGWVDEDSYALNGAYQISTFCAVDGNSYYFDGEGNKIVSEIVYIRSATDSESGFAWSFDANGVATKIENEWVKFIGADGLVDDTKKGYYFNAQEGLAYGLKLNTIEINTIYIFDENGCLIVNVPEYDHNGVIYVIDENGKAKLKEDDE